MAIREYVGARYVPRFTGLYDATRIYDALDVVDNGVGTSYIAKKTVPAGTALTDTEYWFVYGATSGAILDLQTRMTAAEGQITTNTADILTKQNIKDKIIFIGDSYGVATGDATRSYPYLVGDNLGLTENTDYWVNCYGGASWKGFNGKKSFLLLLQELENTIVNKLDITKIVVCGGTNDIAGNMSDIYNGANSFMAYARTHYPNAKVYAGMIGWNLDNSTRRIIANMSYPAYMNLGAFGIGVIENAYMPLHDYRFLQADGTHPTQAGQNELGYMLSSFLISGNACSNGIGEVSTPVTLSNVFTSGSWSIKEKRTNGIIEISWPSVDLAFASGQTVGYDGNITIGTKEKVYWVSDGTYVYDSYVEMQARLVYNDGQYQSRPCMLHVANDNGTLKAIVLLDHDYNNIANPIYLSIQGGNKVMNPLAI